MSVTTQKLPGRGVVLGIAFSLIATLVFFGAQGSAEGTGGVRENLGVILVSTRPGASDMWVRYFVDPSSPLDVNDYDAHQSIDLDRCRVLPSDGVILKDGTNEDETILEFSDGGNKGIGLVSGGIGARTKDNCATGNGQISKSQEVTLSLGSMFDSSIVIDHVEIEIEGKQNADVSFSFDDGTPTVYGLNNPASDNGPDSGTSDNEIVELSPENGFASLTVTSAGPSKALVSIEGGGDGSVAGGTMRTDLGVYQTLFSLASSKTYDGVLDCGESVSALDGTSDGEEGPAVSGTLHRGNNKKLDCEPIPYTFQIQDDSVLFDFPDNEEGARFLVRVDWNPGVDPINPPVREVDFTDDGVDNFVAGVECVAGDTPPGDDPSISDSFEHPTATPVCLAGQKFMLTSDGWQQIQWWDVTGDPRWR